MSETKQCKACHEIKPLDDFYNDYSRKQNKNPRCIPCWKAYINAPHRVEAQGRYIDACYKDEKWLSRKKTYQALYRARKREERKQFLAALKEKESACIAKTLEV